MATSFQIARRYLGKRVKVTMDRPLGSVHSKHGFKYEANYGYVEGVKAPDGEDLDAYYLGVNEPLQEAEGVCVAIAHRANDDDDKLIVLPEGQEMTDAEIMSAILFQEQWFDTTIFRGDGLREVIKRLRTSPSTLCILCGLPYSGKSFIAVEIAQQTGCAVVAIDDFFHARGYVWDTSTLPDTEAWDSIFREAYDATETALANGQSVLFDSTNHTRVSRDRLREVAKRAGAQSLVVYVEAPAEVLWERWRKSESDKTRHVIPKELVEQTIAAFEPPTEDENIAVLHNE